MMRLKKLVVTEMLAAAPMPLAEVAAQSDLEGESEKNFEEEETVEKVLKEEPGVNLGSGNVEYPEMELNEEEEVDSKEAKVGQEIEAKDGEKGIVVAVDDQISVEVQDLRYNVFFLEEMWNAKRLLNDQLVKALSEILEEQNDLKAQVDDMRTECNVSSKDLSKKEKRNTKRKMNNNSDNNSGNS